MCRHRLLGDDDGPMFYVTDQCPHFIRTVPVLQHDKNNMEDLDTEAEDHVADEWRYAMMSRPFISKKSPSESDSKVLHTARAFWEGITWGKKEPTRIRL